MDDKHFEGINMVPFIDIMLVLLAIVLTTSTFIVSGRIPINLPQASSSEQDSSKSETIEIDASGAIYLQGQAVDNGQLKHRLSALDKDTAFVLRADKAVQLQQFIDVADLLKQSGFAKVAVQTEVSQHGNF